MANKQYRIKRKIATINVVAGQAPLQDLPRQYDYEALFLRLSGSVQVSVANATSVRAEAPLQWVNRCEVIADGKNTIFNAPMWFTSLGKYSRPLTESGARATTPPTSPNIATYAVEAIGVIDFMTEDGIRPKDSVFRTRGLSLFQFRPTFGNPQDIFVQGGATIAFSGTPTLELWSAEIVEELDDNGVPKTSPIALKKVSYARQNVAANNSALDQRLPAGNLIKSTVVRAEGLTTAGEPDTGVLNNLILQAGVDVRVNVTGKQARAMNNADYGQLTAGYYVLDVTSKGQSEINLTDLWDVTNQAEPKCTGDVVGGANVFLDYVTTEFILAQPA